MKIIVLKEITKDSGKKWIPGCNNPEVRDSYGRELIKKKLAAQVPLERYINGKGDVWHFDNQPIPLKNKEYRALYQDHVTLEEYQKFLDKKEINKTQKSNK